MVWHKIQETLTQSVKLLGVVGVVGVNKHHLLLTFHPKSVVLESAVKLKCILFSGQTDKLAAAVSGHRWCFGVLWPHGNYRTIKVSEIHLYMIKVG